MAPTAPNLLAEVSAPRPSAPLPPASRRTEIAALLVVATAALAFGASGVAHGTPSTFSYLAVVALVGGGVVRVARGRLTTSVVVGLTGLAVAHLAGGLVAVDDDVLYNASAGSPVLRYDHLVHASGVFLAVLVLGSLLRPPVRGDTTELPLSLVCVLGGLGAGALNETIEFLATLAHDGSHVGGYANTGWDLVANVVGATVAGALLTRRETRVAPSR